MSQYVNGNHSTSDLRDVTHFDLRRFFRVYVASVAAQPFDVLINEVQSPRGSKYVGMCCSYLFTGAIARDRGRDDRNSGSRVYVESMRQLLCLIVIRRVHR